jgi:hypothetical protein
MSWAPRARRGGALHHPPGRPPVREAAAIADGFFPVERTDDVAATVRAAIIREGWEG